MIFEVKEKDLAGRTGKLVTKMGVIETPAFFPVINPRNNIIPVNILKNKFKIKNIITNAYILSKYLIQRSMPIRDIHEILNFNDIIMTDSGAYQILVYKKVSIDPIEIIEIQEKLNSDIAVILDIPTSGTASYKEARETVWRTIKNAKISIEKITRSDIIWVGPVQGGIYTDLVRYCARKIGSMNFQMHAIGGPTQLMENYRFDDLVDLVVNAKRELPINRPVHLFGAGHPLILPLLVALGCDTFDSASYAIYARDDRYITPTGTIKLDRLEVLPCNCEVCRKYEAKELKELDKKSRMQILAEHNLSVIIKEINNIKQAIHEGTLWELIEIKARAHPQLHQAVLRLMKYRKYLEKYDPSLKGKVKGIFYFSYEGLSRPEITRHLIKLQRNVRFHDKKILLLIPDPIEKPYHKSKKVKRIIKIVNKTLRERAVEVHECIYCVPFGIIPLEIDEIYPLTQHEKSIHKDLNSYKVILKAAEILLKNNNYRFVIIYKDEDHHYLNEKIVNRLKKLCNKLNVKVKIVRNGTKELKEILKTLSGEILHV